jgi:hypothetical protein
MNGIFVFIIIWSSCYLVNTFLLYFSPTSAWYAKLLSKNGFSIHALQIKWYTAKCNRLFIRLSSWRANFWHLWFNLGVIVGLVGQVLSLILLIYTAVDFFRTKENGNDNNILIPVVNISVFFVLKFISFNILIL